MAEIEKVLYALHCRAIDCPATCAECAYYVPKWSCCNLRQIMRDILDLLNAQMPRVMTWREIVHPIEIEAPAIWLEDRDKIHVIPALTIISSVTNSENATFVVRGKRIDVKHSDYGKRWRAWTARPTEEQRETVKWDD